MSEWHRLENKTFISNTPALSIAWVVENGELFCYLDWMCCFGVLLVLWKCQLKKNHPECWVLPSQGTSNTKALSCGPAVQTQVLRQTHLRNYSSKPPSSSGAEKSHLNFLFIKLTVSIPNFKWRMFTVEIIGSSYSSHTKCVPRKKKKNPFF